MEKTTILILFLLCLPPPCRGQSRDRVDLLLIERPLALRIYNRYQQAVTQMDAAVLRAFTPLEIVQNDAVLSDDFTHAMTVRTGGKLFHLLKDGRNRLIDEPNAGRMTTLPRCTVLSDTLRLLTGMTLFPTPSGLGAGVSITTGTLVRRFYRYEERDYVESPGGFGWARFDAAGRGKTWEASGRNPSGASVTPEALRRDIARLLDTTNRAMHSLFEQLNRRSGQNLTAPTWGMTFENGAIRCALADPAHIERFEQSARYLINDIDALARPAGYTLTYETGAILLRKKR
ncbi:MAG: hypothetical protein FJY97_12120 [candidate division Zixibacteria bacterium]|nr:hypothetical protein [candidate division Zixibacteria bacterium]